MSKYTSACHICFFRCSYHSYVDVRGPRIVRGQEGFHRCRDVVLHPHEEITPLAPRQRAYKELPPFIPALLLHRAEYRGNMMAGTVGHGLLGEPHHIVHVLKVKLIS